MTNSRKYQNLSSFSHFLEILIFSTFYILFLDLSLEVSFFLTAKNEQNPSTRVEEVHGQDYRLQVEWQTVTTPRLVLRTTKQLFRCKKLIFWPEIGN